MRKKNHIAVWSTSVDGNHDDPLESQLWRMLDPVERDRAGRFRFAHDRRIFVAAHALKRLLLAELCDRPPEQVCVSTASSGKPVTVGMNGASFNISHCDGLVACAASLTLDPGVDCEPLDSQVQPEHLTDYLAPAERRWLADQPRRERARAVVCLWTLKEAFLKAAGLGLAQPPAAIAFALSPPRVVFHNPAFGNEADWHFELTVTEEHVLALAWRADHLNTVVTCTPVQFEVLLARRRG